MILSYFAALKKTINFMVTNSTKQVLKFLKTFSSAVIKSFVGTNNKVKVWCSCQYFVTAMDYFPAVMNSRLLQLKNKYVLCFPAQPPLQAFRPLCELPRCDSQATWSYNCSPTYFLKETVLELLIQREFVIVSCYFYLLLPVFHYRLYSYAVSRQLKLSVISNCFSILFYFIFYNLLISFYLLAFTQGRINLVNVSTDQNVGKLSQTIVHCATTTD